jgi:MFS family permease
VVRVLKLSAYRRLLSAYALNEIAWSVGTLALAVLVYRRTGSALGAAGFFICAQFVPALIAPALVAKLEDRPTRAILPLLYVTEAIAFGALAWVARHHPVAPVLALVLADGVVALTARSLARAASVAVLNPAGLLGAGNALMNSVFSVCFFLGPALGGGVVAIGGTTAALLTNSGLFLVVALTIATAADLPESPSASVTDQSQEPLPPGRVRAALAYARQQRAIRALLSMQAVGLVFYTISIPVEVVFAEHTLHAGTGGYAAMLAGWGAGAVVGSLAYARWHGLPARALIGSAAAAMATGFVVMASAPTIVVATVGAVIAGAGNGVEAVASRTALQERVEQRWMAVMISLGESLVQGVPGIGILIGGAIAALAGARVAFAVAGAGALAIAATAWIILRPTMLGDTGSGSGNESLA